MSAEKHRPLVPNQEASEANPPHREVTVAKGKGEDPDAATAPSEPGDPAEGADAAKRAG